MSNIVHVYYLQVLISIFLFALFISRFAESRLIFETQWRIFKHGMIFSQFSGQWRIHIGIRLPRCGCGGCSCGWKMWCFALAISSIHTMTQFIVDVPIIHIMKNVTLATSPNAFFGRSFVTLMVCYDIQVPTIVFNSRKYRTYGRSRSSEDLLNCWSWYNIIRCVSRIISPSLSRKF